MRPYAPMRYMSGTPELFVSKKRAKPRMLSSRCLSRLSFQAFNTLARSFSFSCSNRWCRRSSLRACTSCMASATVMADWFPIPKAPFLKRKILSQVSTGTRLHHEGAPSFSGDHGVSYMFSSQASIQSCSLRFAPASAVWFTLESRATASLGTSTSNSKPTSTPRSAAWVMLSA